MLTQILPSIYRWAIYAVVGAAILATVAGKAYLAGDDHGQGLVRAQDAIVQKAVDARFIWNVNNGVTLAAKLAAADASADRANRKLNKRIADDTHPIVPAPAGSTALPQLTLAAVSLWDGKWAGIELSGGTAAGIDAAGTGTPAADAKGASGFDIRDALYSNALDADACWKDIRLYQAIRQFELDRAAHAKP